MARSAYVYYTVDTRYGRSSRVFTVKHEAIAFAQTHNCYDVYRARVANNGGAEVEMRPWDTRDRVYRHGGER